RGPESREPPGEPPAAPKAPTRAAGAVSEKRPPPDDFPDIPDFLLRPQPAVVPPDRRPAEQRDEFATPDHSITSSARARSVGGISRPIALAVVRLMIRSNLVGCATGMSAGFAPRRILSMRSPARRHRSGKFGPYDTLDRPLLRTPECYASSAIAWRAPTC